MNNKGKINGLTGKFSDVNFWFLLFSLLSLALAFNKIVIDIGFYEIPIFFLLLGFITYLLKAKKSLNLFIFLLPLVTAFPYFFPNGFPYNYMAVLLFYLSGILIASVVKREKLDFNYSWSIYYLFFLIIIWISAVFVFLKWSNITINSLAFLKDTPVEPGGTRVSFSSIFPILTLFLFSVSPYIAVLLKKNKIFREQIFIFLLPGYCISVLISLYQMFVDQHFLKMKMNFKAEADQFSGGFSDFNSFGFFSGVMFLSLSIFLIDYLHKKENKNESLKTICFYITGIIFSLIGIFVSGSRAAFIYIISSLLIFFFSKKVKKRVKLVALILILVFLLAGGGVLKRRVSNTFDRFYSSFSSDNFIQTLDKASNYRITMFQNSFMILKNYPIAGVGTGGFLFYLKDLKFGQKYLEDLPLNHYLLIFDEGGFIALLAFLLIFITIITNLKDKFYSILVATIYITLFFNNYFWFPEALLIFWIIVSIGGKDDISPEPIKKWRVFTGIALISIFIVANINTFNDLHPVNLTTGKNVLYDYGFWYPERDNNNNKYYWSKAESGLYLPISEAGVSKRIKISCGAPLSNLKNNLQNLKIFWKGELFREVDFRENKSIELVIKDLPDSGGFLEFRVLPTFNLKKLGISEETRNLGIKVFLMEQNG